MRVKLFFVGIAICLLVGGLHADAATLREKETPAERRGNPWDMLDILKEKTTSLFDLITPLKAELKTLTERVDALAQKSTQQDTHDVAFIFWDPDGVHVLKKDGTVWKCPSCGWTPDDDPYDLTPPVSTQDIVEWELFTFLDKNGDVWLFNESFGWRNYEHP